MTGELTTTRREGGTRRPRCAARGPVVNVFPTRGATEMMSPSRGCCRLLVSPSTSCWTGGRGSCWGGCLFSQWGWGRLHYTTGDEAIPSTCEGLTLSIYLFHAEPIPNMSLCFIIIIITLLFFQDVRRRYFYDDVLMWWSMTLRLKVIQTSFIAFVFLNNFKAFYLVVFTCVKMFILYELKRS